METEGNSALTGMEAWGLRLILSELIAGVIFRKGGTISPRLLPNKPGHEGARMPRIPSFPEVSANVLWVQILRWPIGNEFELPLPLTSGSHDRRAESPMLVVGIDPGRSERLSRQLD
jgi:hypothetical protein